MLLKIEQEMRRVTKNRKKLVISREFSIFHPFPVQKHGVVSNFLVDRRGRFVKQAAFRKSRTKSNVQSEHNYCVGNV